MSTQPHYPEPVRPDPPEPTAPVRATTAHARPDRSEPVPPVPSLTDPRPPTPGVTAPTPRPSPRTRTATSAPTAEAASAPADPVLLPADAAPAPPVTREAIPSLAVPSVAVPSVAVPRPVLPWLTEPVRGGPTRVEQPERPVPPDDADAGPDAGPDRATPAPVDEPLSALENEAAPTLLPSGGSIPGPAGFEPPEEEGRRRFRFAPLLAAALALVALVVVVGAVRGLGGEGAAPATAAPAGPPGSEVTVALAGDGDLRVTERLVLPGPARSVQLTRPDLPADGSLRLPQPVVSGLYARVGDTSADVRATADGWVVEATEPFTEVTVGYEAADAVETGAPSPVEGRALLVVTPVTAAAARELAVPVVVRAPGIDVRQAVCVSSPSTQQLCGEADTESGTTLLDSWQGVAVMILQADLPT